MDKRILNWDGCKNVRDLGGLPMLDGRLTRWGALIRSDTPSRLTPAGWQALYDYGVRTTITLCTAGMVEDELNFTPPYPDVVRIPIEIEDINDTDFVERFVNNSFWGTPLYYRDALRRWPEKHAAVISAIGRAQPGGVLFHCIRGHDRTGIISLLALALVGVGLEEITADYELSADPVRDEVLRREGVTAGAALHSALDGLDLDRYLLDGGASQADLASFRQRLLGQTEHPSGAAAAVEK